MAARKSSRKRKQSHQDPLDVLAAILSRPEVIGLILVLVSVLTLLSLLTSSTGAITGAWLEWLTLLFGIGVWGFPLVTGAIGLWMVILAVEKMPNMPWRHPVGLGVLFLAGLIGTSLWAGPGAVGGGAIGSLLADNLREVLGVGVAWAFVTFLIISGLLFLTERLLIDLALNFWWSLEGLLYGLAEQRQAPGIDPPVPLPSGQLSFWREMTERWRERWGNAKREAEPFVTGNGNLVQPHGARPVPRVVGGADESPPKPPTASGKNSARNAPAETANTRDAARGQASGQAQGAQGTTAPINSGNGENELLKPRIVGNSAQEWRLPTLGDMLSDWERRTDSDELIRDQGRLIQETLALFGVPADFEGAYKGPSVTQYLIKPGYVERTVRGERKRIKVKVSKIAGLANDLALALAAPSVRIEAPIPGTGYVGIEVPNHEGNKVGLKELMESDVFETSKAKLRIALGEDVKGQPIISDMARMPHLLIAGATGAGKSVCINSIITCLLLTNTPDRLRLLMVDPKMVELSVYNGIPHLLSPVITEVDKAAGVLFWAVKEMERRYGLFSKVGARDLVRYNEYLVKRGEKELPYIVVIIDEMADLMMAAPEEVEKHVCRLAQMARAVGIHLIIATQRPSVDVITGLIKANFPARIAFAVTSQTDSRVILDVQGAERLLGRGDMLFMAPDAGKLERLQGTFLDDDEIFRIVRYWKGVRTLDTPTEHKWSNGGNGDSVDTFNDSEHDALLQRATISASDDSGMPLPATEVLPAIPDPSLPTTKLEQAPLFEQIEVLKNVDQRDELFDDATRVVQEAGRGSVSLLQRRLRIGYNRASRIIDQLEEAGLLGPDQGGSMGRVVYIGRDGESNDDPPESNSRGAEATKNRRQSAADRLEPDDPFAAEEANDDDDDSDGNDDSATGPGADKRPRVWM